MAGKLPYAAGMFVVEIDGTASGHCTSVSGGHIKADVSEMKTGTGFVRKAIAGIAVEPIKLELGLGMGKNMIEWMRAFSEGTDLRKSGILHACDYGGKSMAIREFGNAMITECSWPALDAKSKDFGKLNLTVVAEGITETKGSGAKVGAALNKAQKMVSLQSFGFELAGLPCDGITKIDAMKQEVKFAKAQNPQFRSYVITPTSKSVSNLKVTFDMADYDAWYQSYKRFVIEGKCTDDDEMTGSIVYFAQDQTTELCRLTIGNVGWISLERQKLEAGKDEIDLAVAEFYVETCLPEIKALV
jgi:phage tail-like protein